MIQDQKVTVTVKQNPNNKVTVQTKEHLGVGGVHGTEQVGARTMGIPGPKGNDGEKGERGEKGDTGAPGNTGAVGLTWQGDYNPTATYQQRDGVHYAGTSYIYTYGLPTSGNAPPDPTYWDVLAGGGTSGDKSHVHVQSVASTEWNINHGLGKFPSITVVDSGNTEVEGDVEFIDPDNIVVRFSAAFGGRAYLN